MATVRQIASSLGISGATVSRALNDHPEISAETKAKVLEAARSVGYVGAVGRRPTNVIALVYPQDPVRADFGGFEAAILGGILRGANERGFDLTIINLGKDRSDREDCTQFFRRKGVRGALVRAIEPGSTLAEQITEEGFPCVLLADRSENPRVSYVDCESRSTSRTAVEHLIAHGHTRIALATHSLKDSDHIDRERGYEDAIRAAGFQRDAVLTISGPANMRTGGLMIDHLLRLESPPTAIYFTNPHTTIGALHRCLQLGIRVPEQLSIVGFDDGEARLQTFPAYTAVCQDAHRLAVEATRWLVRKVRGEVSEPLHAKHDTVFSIHESSGFCPRTPHRLENGPGLGAARAPAPIDARAEGGTPNDTLPRATL